MSPKRRSFLLLMFTRLSYTAFAYKNFGGWTLKRFKQTKDSFTTWLELCYSKNGSKLHLISKKWQFMKSSKCDTLAEAIGRQNGQKMAYFATELQSAKNKRKPTLIHHRSFLCKNTHNIRKMRIFWKLANVDNFAKVVGRQNDRKMTYSGTEI